MQDAVVRLRDRIYVPDGLLTRQSDKKCDSALDGPHCGHLEAEKNSVESANAAAIRDGASYISKCRVVRQVARGLEKAHSLLPGTPGFVL